MGTLSLCRHPMRLLTFAQTPELKKIYETLRDEPDLIGERFENEILSSSVFACQRITASSSHGAQVSARLSRVVSRDFSRALRLAPGSTRLLSYRSSHLDRRLRARVSRFDLRMRIR